MSAAVATSGVGGARPARGADVMLWVIVAFVVVAIGWAAVARIDTVTRGAGRVVPARQLQRVAHLEGGIVTAILARAGDRVRAGQPLIRLDPVAATAELGQGAVGRDALQARLARLEAEMGGGAPAFAAGLERSAPAQVAAERTLYRARRIELEAALAAARARAAGAERALAEAGAEARARVEARDYAARDLALIEPLVAKGIEPEAEANRARSALAQARSAVDAARAAEGRARAGLAEARADARAVTERYRAGAQDALATTRGELARLGEGMPALSDRLRRTTVAAPVTGTVNRVLVETVGGVVRPGEPLVEIVPADDALVVETRVAPQDIGFIHPGQRANVRVTAYDFAVYGGLDGEVIGISPDAVVDEARGESYYLVRVRTRDSLRDAAGRPLAIVPGMVAEVDVLGRPRSVLSYLLTPLERVRSTALRER